MKCKGEITGLSLNWQTKKPEVTLALDSNAEDLERLQGKQLSVEIKRYRQKRSLDANALLWHCLEQIAEALNTDKWSVYLEMLKRYGQFTYIIVKEDAVESVKKQWRECEVVGSYTVNGQKGVQLLCYYGSSTYDTKEFSILLDGVISEMKEMGLETPCGREILEAMKKWEKLGSGSKKTADTK